MKEKFVQQLFFLQFKRKPADLETRLTVLYNHYTKYTAEAAAQLSTYGFVMEYVTGVFEEAKSNANSKYQKKVVSPSNKSDDPNKNYETVSEVYKFNDPDIIAIELSCYVELLKWTETRIISKRKQRKLLNCFAGHL
ncbi:hypothetical protein [Domibacillus indicus]|uniref:hypothetical protein n=1 Tax=Domibacillus indicus TaxID=1437523 RepID=UPI0012E0963A|nr:hypothetical protein [Domibacillus indicus]